jgi:hypothetical protein
MKKEQIEIAKKVFKSLIDLGLTGQKLLLCMAQIMHETGGFKARNFINNNNVGGINWAGQKNAVKGNFVSAKYNGKDGYYAKFNSLKDGINEYYGLLQRRYSKALASVTPFDFARALKEKGYYSAPLNEYSNALKNWLFTINKIGLPELIEEKKKAIDNNYFIYRLDNFLGDLFKK